MSRQAIILALTLAVPVVLAQAPTSRSSQAAGLDAIQADAWQIVVLANQARAEAGVEPLKWDAALAVAARRHCLRMVAEGQISHQYEGEADPGTRAAEAGAHFSLFEENVALAPTVYAIHDGWMYSPHHRVNLLNPEVDHIGVAVVAGRHGLYAVADYERAVPELTQKQVESRFAALLKQAGMEVLPDAALAREACATDDGMPKPATGPKPRFVMRWQGANLTRLPQELANKLATEKFRWASVGNCTMQGQDTFTAYRIAVLLY
jgi:uncharacterized protein YkwD